MNVTSLTQEFLSLNATQAFGVVTSEEEFLCCFTKSFSSCFNWASNAFSKPCLCFCGSEPPHGDVHVLFWEQRGVCSHCSVTADMSLFPNRREAVITKWWALLASLLDCLNLGGLTRLWVLGWTIFFTRDGFVGFTDPPIKKLLFSSLAKHFPHLAPIILSFSNSKFLCVMYLSRKEEIVRAIGISLCHFTFLGKVVVELEEKILYWRCRCGDTAPWRSGKSLGTVSA